MKTIKYLLCVLLVVMGMATLDSCCYPSPWSCLLYTSDAADE